MYIFLFKKIIKFNLKRNMIMKKGIGDSLDYFLKYVGFGGKEFYSE